MQPDVRSPLPSDEDVKQAIATLRRLDIQQQRKVLIAAGIQVGVGCVICSACVASCCLGCPFALSSACRCRTGAATCFAAERGSCTHRFHR